jgi:hypothetical protein
VPADPLDGGTAHSLLPLGDIDGDGFADLAFTAPTASGERGRYIKYGRPLSVDIQ